jgi:hypothetical protein
MDSNSSCYNSAATGAADAVAVLFAAGVCAIASLLSGHYHLMMARLQT